MNSSNPHAGRGRCSREILLAAAASACLLSSASMAAIVTSPAANVPVPQTTAGVYINVITGVTSDNPALVPGWDLNPWGSTTLNLFWPGTGATTIGVVAASASDPALVLMPGDTIGPASSFNSNGAATNPNFRATQTGFLGFRFRNEGTGLVNYGYMEISTTGPNGHPAIVNSIVYEDTGAAITIPNPLPPTAANLRVSLSGPSIPVRSGTSVPIYLRLDNYGPDAAYPPTIEFTSSSPAGSVSITPPSGWICEGNGGETRPAGGESPSVVIAGAVFVCTANGNLPRGGTRFAFQVTAPANPPGGFITINASASSESVDPVSSNNTATFKLYVKPSDSLISPVAPSIR